MMPRGFTPTVEYLRQSHRKAPIVLGLNEKIERSLLKIFLSVLGLILLLGRRLFRLECIFRVASATLASRGKFSHLRGGLLTRQSRCPTRVGAKSGKRRRNACDCAFGRECRFAQSDRVLATSN